VIPNPKSPSIIGETLALNTIQSFANTSDCFGSKLLSSFVNHPTMLDSKRFTRFEFPYREGEIQPVGSKLCQICMVLIVKITAIQRIITWTLIATSFDINF
jgi:hypothetical protein